jgi:hypothetical protein
MCEKHRENWHATMTLAVMKQRGSLEIWVMGLNQIDSGAPRFLEVTKRL